MYDALSVLQAEVTKTVTFSSTGYDLKTGTPPRGEVARVLYKAAANASGSNTVTFSIEDSSDNSSFASIASAAAITLSTTAQTGEIFIPFSTRKRYVRLVATVAGAGGSPTITYSGQIGLSQP